MSCVLSFDFGTGGVRCGCYDLEKGEMIGRGEASYETSYPRAGWAEQQPEHWWDALLKVGNNALGEAGIRDIAALCVATTASTVVVATRSGRPLRPALLWMDCRATEEAKASNALTHPVMAYSGGGDAVEWLVPKAMWLARHERETYMGAEIICEALDFINFRLTGQWVGSRMNAACKWNYDSMRGQFVPEIYHALGIAELAQKLPPQIVPVGGVIGSLRQDVAAALGLTSCPLVAQGGIDAHIGMLGANTLDVGSMLAIGGTSNVFLTHLDGYHDVHGFWGPYPNALLDNFWLVEAGQVSTGSILHWLVETIFGLDEAGHHTLIQAATEQSNKDVGLLALDYWMGNRTPYRKGNLRGAIMGLSLGHGRADIYAALVQALALGSANVLYELKGHNIAIERLVMAGGICHNPLWLQATVDALAMPVQLAREDNLTLIGACASAAHAAGIFSDLTSAARACAAPTIEIAPNARRSSWFHETLSLYREVTSTLMPSLEALAARQAMNRFL